MVLAYSRHLFVYPVLRMDQQAWVDAHVAAFEFFGSCPRRVVLDNLRAGVIKPDIYDPKINRAYAELAAHYGVLVDPARVGQPKDKPRIEAVQLYISRSFFAGRDFASLAGHGGRGPALVRPRWQGGGRPEPWRGAHPSRSSMPKRPAPSCPCRWCPSSLPDGAAPRSAPTPMPRSAAPCTRCLIA